MRFVVVLASAACVALAQQHEATISKDDISVHQVRRGTMPLREMATGSITSTDPAKATVSLLRDGARSLQVGQTASVQIKPPQVIPGKLASIGQSSSPGMFDAEIELAAPLPAGVSVGTKVYGLIDVGEVRDVVFFERSVDSRPNTESTIFLLEPDGQYAKRVPVRYGRQAGALMEIISGLSPGDRVIVSDMSAWAAHARVRLK